RHTRSTRDWSSDVCSSDLFLQQQFTATISDYPALPLVPSTPTVDCPANSICRRDNYTLYPVQTQFFTNALYRDDQLRQRVAFALDRKSVVGGVDIGQGYPSRFRSEERRVGRR